MFVTRPFVWRPAPCLRAPVHRKLKHTDRRQCTGALPHVPLCCRTVFFLPFPFCFLSSLNWSRENQSIVPCTPPDFLMPPTSFFSCYHLEVLDHPPHLRQHLCPLLLPSALGTAGLFVPREVARKGKGVKSALTPWCGLCYLFCSDAVSLSRQWRQHKYPHSQWRWPLFNKPRSGYLGGQI